MSKLKRQIVVRAPTRADLAGGTLDLWPLYTQLGSARTINFSVDLPAEVQLTSDESSKWSLKLTHTGQELEHELGSLEIERLPPHARLPFFLVQSFIHHFQIPFSLSLQMHIHTQVPSGSGLGGSSALSVAIVSALWELTQGEVHDQAKWQIMAVCRDLEAQFLGVPTGTQDYLGSLFGGLSSYRSHPGGIEFGRYSQRVSNELSQRYLLLFSGQTHQSGLSNWEVYKKWIEKDARVLKGGRELAQIAEKTHDFLTGPTDDWSELGKLMTEEWKARSELFDVSTLALEKIISHTQALNGVLGVKVCGAAQGGSLLVLCEPHQKDNLSSQLHQNGVVVLGSPPLSSAGIEIIV